MPLIIVWLEGGLAEKLPPSSHVWLDLTGNKWGVLCSPLHVEDIASLSGGTEVSREEWNGEPFGDGHSGTVSSPLDGVLNGLNANPPQGWVSLHGSFQGLAGKLTGLTDSEQEAAIWKLAGALSLNESERQDFAEELRETLTVMEAA